MDETKKIEALIEEALKETAELVKTGRCSGSKIIMPHYREKKDVEKHIRYSEQELKQIFLNLVEKDNTFYYSVETPSKCVYSISNSPIPEIKEQKEKDDHFESARFDVSLYSSNQPEALYSHAEFKHDNPDTKEISKDLLKLTHEFGTGQTNYFIHYIVNKSNKWQSETFPSIMKKYCEAISSYENNKLSFDKVFIFLMFVKKGTEEFEYKILKFTLQELSENEDSVCKKFSDAKIESWVVKNE